MIRPTFIADSAELEKRIEFFAAAPSNGMPWPAVIYVHGHQGPNRPTMRRRLYASLAALQADLDAWLRHYNHERPHLGYRNQGRRPWDTVERFVTQSPARQGG